MGITQLGMWVARKGFIDKNRAAMLDFMEDAMRCERWYFDPENHDEAVKIAVAVTKIPAPTWDSWLFKKDGQAGDYYRDPNGHADIPDIQKSIDTQVKLGVIKQSIDVKPICRFQPRRRGDQAAEIERRRGGGPVAVTSAWR